MAQHDHRRRAKAQQIDRHQGVTRPSGVIHRSIYLEDVKKPLRKAGNSS
jgi:hypothetical protein